MDKDTNYKMPFNSEKLMNENSSIEKCSLAESIARNLMLLITTKKGENRFDLEYGNEVWNLEFENGISLVDWEKTFIESMKQLITAYEPRIFNPIIQVHVDYVEHTYDTKKYSEIKKKAKIAITAKLISTNENFNFTTELYLSPMSVD